MDNAFIAYQSTSVENIVGFYLLMIWCFELKVYNLDLTADETVSLGERGRGGSFLMVIKKLNL